MDEQQNSVEKDLTVPGGMVALSFSAGKASIIASSSFDNGAIAVGASVAMDAGAFIDQLEAIVAKAVPVSAPIDPLIFAAIKSAVMSIQ